MKNGEDVLRQVGLIVGLRGRDGPVFFFFFLLFSILTLPDRGNDRCQDWLPAPKYFSLFCPSSLPPTRTVFLVGAEEGVRLGNEQYLSRDGCFLLTAF